MRLRKNKAFSLLEVLIAVGILTSGVVLVLRAFTSALGSARLSQNVSLACYFAQQKIWECQQEKSNSLDQGEENRFKWKYEVKPTDMANLSEMNFDISWSENIREKDYNVTFNQLQILDSP